MICLFPKVMRSRANNLSLRVVFAGLCFGFLVVSASAQKYSCLPSDIKEDSIVRIVEKTSPKGDTFTRVTVGQTLKKLRAKCFRGKLIDSRKREIRFFQLQGCWGNPPDDYLAVLHTQKKELARLKKRYTVIEMTCNSDGTPTRLIS